jgi:hypothetical protein
MKINPIFQLLFCFYLLSYNSLFGQSENTNFNSARFLCDKTSLTIQEISSQSNSPDFSPGTCFRSDFTETNTMWFKWQVAESGTLSFTILPIIDTDDIDFVLYRLTDLDKFTSKEAIRCMAAGPNLGEEPESTFTCTGATGLREQVNTSELPSGCQSDGQNFLRPVDMLSGESYALYISNFRSSKGVLIEWGGSGTFNKIPERCSSNIITKTPLGNGTIHLSEPFPNPGSSIVRVEVKSELEQSGQLQVISAEGYIEMIQAFNLSVGSNTLEIPAENLRPGVHLIKIKTGGEVYPLRFVKH